MNKDGICPRKDTKVKQEDFCNYSGSDCIAHETHEKTRKQDGWSIVGYNDK
ncbi:MAG: hypothetical protein RBT80_28055 [Candidatus Vecturithrix sp.]|nr:hypothetical protein [Candidatus Vecturithrix sp.]